MAKASDIYIANKTACVSYNGSPAFIKRGFTTVRKGHPLYEQNPSAFSPLDVQFDVDAPKPAPKAEPKHAAAKAEPVRPTVKDTTETRTGEVDF